MATAGVPRAEQLNFLGDGQFQGLFAQAAARLRALGVATVEVDIGPLLAAAQLLYAGPWVAERAAATEELLLRDPAAIHPVVRGILEAGQRVTGIETFRGQYSLKAHERAAARLWRTVDVLLLPTIPTVYPIAEVLADPVALNSALGLYTNFVNLLDMSAIALPAGFRDDGPGFGVTLIGPAFADRRLRSLASRLDAATAFTPPPLDLKRRPAAR
jgi:allophanate hydrolase